MKQTELNTNIESSDTALEKTGLQESPDDNGAESISDLEEPNDEGTLDQLPFTDEDFAESFCDEQVIEHFNQWAQSLESEIGNLVLFQDVDASYCKHFFDNVHVSGGGDATLPPFSFVHFAIAMGIPTNDLTAFQAATFLVKDKHVELVAD